MTSPQAIAPAAGYAGDITSQQAWQWVQGGTAVLVDVRSSAELEWVGRVPGAAAVPWKQWPGMAMNPDFDAQLRAAVPHGQSVVLLCRSGVRSIAAAQRATELGLTAYNILEGFAGALKATRTKTASADRRDGDGGIGAAQAGQRPWLVVHHHHGDGARVLHVERFHHKGALAAVDQRHVAAYGQRVERRQRLAGQSAAVAQTAPVTKNRTMAELGQAY
eukprot:gene34823-42946_t